MPNLTKMLFLTGALIFLFGSIPAIASSDSKNKSVTEQTNNRRWFDSLTTDTINGEHGDHFIRIRYTDISVHLTPNGWNPQDSIMFFTQRRKTEAASQLLLHEIDAGHDSLKKFMDSAGARVGSKILTTSQVDSIVGKWNNDIQNDISTQKLALRRLEDYRKVLNAVNEILKRKDD